MALKTAQSLQLHSENVMELISKSNLLILKELLERICKEDGLLSDLKHNNVVPIVPEKLTQVALLQDLAKKIVSQFETDATESTALLEEDFLIFIAILLITNKMEKADEISPQGMVEKESRLRLITDKILEQLSYLVGDQAFDIIKNKALIYANRFKNTIFNNDYKEYLAKQINRTPQDIENIWNKIKFAIPTPFLQLEGDEAHQNISNLPLKPISSELVKNANGVIDKLLHNANQILQPLVDLPKSDISFKELFNEIESHKIMVEKECQTLKAYQKADTAISRKELEKMIFQLNYHLIQAYKAVIAKAQHYILPKRKITRFCYQNMMHCYIKILIFFYKKSRKIPNKIWFEIHSTYMQAVNQQVATKTLSQIPQWHNQFNTIKDMYKYCLLLGLIDEYQFCSDEINQLVYALESWAPLLSIHKVKEEGDTYFVDMGKDAPAERLQAMNDYSDCVHFINIKKIIDHVYGLIHYLNTPGRSDHSKLLSDSELVLKKSLIERVIEHWNKAATEFSSFTKVNESLLVQFGITFNTTASKMAPSIQEKDDQGKITEYINIDLLPYKEKSAEEVVLKKYHCLVLGIDGCYLKSLWKGELPSELQPGEIVSLYNDEYTNHLQIGIIKSVFIDDDDNSLVIIRKFPQNASVVTASLPQGPQSAIYHVIFIFEQSDNPSVTLVAPLITFHEGQEVKVIGQDIEGTILLGKPIEFYHTHQLFEASFV